MANNEAVVCRLANITKIEGADKIVSAQVILNDIPLTQVVVGVDTKENTPVVYFDSNLSINQEVIDKIDKLSPDYGKEGFNSLGNYLARGNRVRCIKLKGTISNGLAVEVDKFIQFLPGFAYKDNGPFVEGYTFTSIDGMEVCKKWLPPVKNSQSNRMKEKRGNKKEVSRIIPELFHFHIDTQNYKYNVTKVNPEDIISISRKVHGTSAIVSHTKVLRKLSIVEKISKFLGVKVDTTEYDYLYASRTVIKNDSTNGGFYGVDLWSDIGKKEFLGKLNKGESVYYEIIGYIPNTEKFIQKNYDYGCKKGEYKIAVYRITSTNDEGKVVEYSWQAVKERCKEMNVPMVEEFYVGKAKDLFPELSTTEHWHENFLENLKKTYLEKDCWDNLCKKVPDEGVVIRLDRKDIEVYKLKSENFLVGESKAKEDENNVDLEEQEQAQA